MKRHITIIAVASLAAVPVAYNVSPVFLPQAKAQGPAGCYDPGRVSGQQLRLLQNWGTPPCKKSGPSKAAQTKSRHNQIAPPPAGYEATSADGWAASDDEISVDDRNGIGVSLGVLCDGGLTAFVMPTVLLRGISYSTRDPAAFSRNESARVFGGLSSIVVSAFDAKGNVLSRFTVRQAQPSSFTGKLTRAQLNGIKASTRLEASNDRWTADFSGKSAARALSALKC